MSISSENRLKSRHVSGQEKPIKRVAVTGAAGQIAYNLLFRIGSGELFGDDQPIALHLLEIPEALQALEGVKMELQDCAFPLLREIKTGANVEEAFAGVHWALLVGSKPRGPGMERKELLQANGKIFSTQGKALGAVADRDVRVIVVGNPCNTNCWIAMQNAPQLDRKQFHAMTRLDENRAKQSIAQHVDVPVKLVRQMAIWGNHSATQVPDFFHATIDGVPLLERCSDQEWLKGPFIEQVQKRGAAIIAARGKSSAASAANAVIDAVHALIHPTPEGEWFSSGVFSEKNPYGIPENLVFSFPCRSTGNGDFTIVPGLEIPAFLRQRLELTTQELLEEQKLVPL